jgi:hypothetical protein
MNWTSNANMLIELLASPPCFHQNTEGVWLSTGELVAQLCTDCDQQLAAGFMGRYNHKEVS